MIGKLLILGFCIILLYYIWLSVFVLKIFASKKKNESQIVKVQEHNNNGQLVGKTLTTFIIQMPEEKQKEQKIEESEIQEEIEVEPNGEPVPIMSQDLEMISDDDDMLYDDDLIPSEYDEEFDDFENGDDYNPDFDHKQEGYQGLTYEEMKNVIEVVRSENTQPDDIMKLDETIRKFTPDMLQFLDIQKRNLDVINQLMDLHLGEVEGEQIQQIEGSKKIDIDSYFMS